MHRLYIVRCIAVLLLQNPFLEKRRLVLADDDTFRNGQQQIDRQAAAEPEGDVFNRFAGDDELAVGTKETVCIELFAQLVEGTVYGVLAAVGGIGRHLFLGGVEEVDRFDGERVELVGELYQQALDDMAVLDNLVGQQDMLFPLVGTEKAELIECPFEVGGADGLQQVVDAAHLEGLQGIFVVRRREDDRRIDLHLFENPERRAVGQMDVHEDKVRLRITAEVVDAIFRTFQFGYYFNGEHSVLFQNRS